MDREKYMSLAMELAREAGDAGEVPVGCVVVDENGRVIGRGRNRREEGHDATAHAELEAIREACAATGDWRLSGCSIFVTLEPCPMCAGAIINSRISRVVFGAYDSKAGAFGSVMDMNSFALNHKCEVEGGVLESDCAALLSGFFSDLRKKKSKLRE